MSGKKAGIMRKGVVTNRVGICHQCVDTRGEDFRNKAVRCCLNQDQRRVSSVSHRFPFLGMPLAPLKSPRAKTRRPNLL